MNARVMAVRALSILALGATTLASAVAAEPADPRLREVLYDARAVVTVPVRRGIVTHVMLGDDEVISDVGAGLGGDCSKAEAVWCIAAQAGTRNLFVKPKSGATAPNNLAVVTDRRTHAFRFVVLADGDARPAVFRLVVKAPLPHALARPATSAAMTPALAALLAPPTSPPIPTEVVVAERLKATPQVLNTTYSIAEGKNSADIVPALVFDDGRFTYMRFPGNRDVPAVFHVLGDGSETLVNARMEGDLLVVDRVSRRLVLRAGMAVVGVWNDAFDLDGVPPGGGTTVPGVERTIKAEANTSGAKPGPAGVPR
jgi:type IV secretion system protein VirB9